MITFNWQSPSYAPIFRERLERLARIRADKTGRTLALLKLHYRKHPADFISDFGCTYDPRLVARDLPAVVPFILFPRQAEWIDWIEERYRTSTPGLTPKSREMGMSWLAVSYAATKCIFNNGMGVGFGSRKEAYVDLIGSPKTLFWKARMFVDLLPVEFRAGFNSKTTAPHMRLMFPDTGSTITGEAGDNIGRGDRQGIYFVDESAFIERPQLIEASLSQTTNCRIDISSANGMANPFAQKVHSWPADRIFTFHWRDDPRKDDAWYAKQVDELDAVTVAQEIDINYAASATGVLIQSSWIQSAINAHVKLGIVISGKRIGAMDVADGGLDLNAACIKRSILVEHVEAWKGGRDEEGDIFRSVERMFSICDDRNVDEWYYDADGMGAGVRGDARVINERRSGGKHTVKPFRGSGELFQPDKQIETAAPRSDARDRIERLNEDTFQNFKAQAWNSLALRFLRTHRAVKLVEAGEANPYDPDTLISLSPDLPRELTLELTQPTVTHNATTGKQIVDKAPDGTRSPNYADSVMIAFAPRKSGSWMDSMR